MPAIARFGSRGSHLIVIGAGAAVVLAAWGGVVLSPGQLLQVDLAFPLEPDAMLDDIRAAWKPSFGSNVIASTRLVAGGLPALITHALGLDTSVAVKAIVALHLLVALGGMYALVHWTLPSDGKTQRAVAAAALVAGLYAALNVWAVAHVHQVFMFTQYAATPLILGLWVEAFQRRQARYAVVAALVFATIGSTNPHFAIFNAAALAIASVVVGARRLPWEQFGRLAGTFAVWGVLLGAFFILPLIGRFFYGGELAPTFDRTVPGVELLSVEQTPGNTLGLVGSAFFSTRARPPDASVFSWQPLAIAPIVLVAAAALRPSPSRRVALVMLAIVVLAAGVQLASWWSVTRDGFAAVVRSFPLGWVVREPERLGGMMAVGYGWALAYWIAVLLGWDGGLRSMRGIGNCMRVTAAAVLAVAVAWPAVVFDAQMIWDRDEFSWRPIDIPAEFAEMTGEIEARISSDEWLLSVTPGLRDPLWDLTRRVAPFETFSIRGRQRFIDPAAAPPAINAFLEAPNGETVGGLLELGISRVLLVHDYSAGMGLHDRFEHSDVLTPELAGEWMTLYSIEGDPRPFMSLEASQTASDADVRWSQTSVTEYKIQIPASNAARQLVVRERFDAGWMLNAPDLSVTPKSFGDAELQQETLLAYDLPPGPAIDATLSFAGASWYLAGIVVSVTALVGLVSSGAIAWLRRRRGDA